MAIASQMPKNYAVTIVARNLPGDEDNKEWASPWAGAIWSGMEGSSEREQKMQLDSLAIWRQLALSDPESSVRRTEMHELFDTGSLEGRVWYRYKIPGFAELPRNELPEDVAFGIRYETIALSPTTFLPWMRGRLEAAGVQFKRAHVRSLADLRGLGHDVLVNATGTGARFLADVKDANMQEVRGQSLLVKSDYGNLLTRRGRRDYTYIFPRGDGTAILGGIKQYDNNDTHVDEYLRSDVCPKKKKEKRKKKKRQQLTLADCPSCP